MVANGNRSSGIRARLGVALPIAVIGLALGILSAAAQVPTSGPKIAKAPPVGRRIALVVGMSRYQFIPALDNPKNDAALIANTLRGVGFTLVGGGAQLDLDKPAFDHAVQEFGRQVAGAEVALFYYAGHGLQVRGTNWLVPISANPTRETDIDFQMVDANLVLRQMEGAGTRLNLMILDACRNNPFGGRGLRATSGGLAQMQAPEGTLISYATQPGNVAADGQDGDSPFTKALARTLKQPGLDVFRLFNEVGLQVKRVTGGVQQPWVSTSPIDGDFYFMTVPTGSTVTVQPPSAAPADRDVVFWDSVKDSRNPAEIRAYLDQFPQGTFAGLAKVKLEDLARNQVAAIPAKPDVAPATPQFAPGIRVVSHPADGLPDITINVPGAEVPESLARFSGVWTGQWDNRFDAMIAVTSIHPNGIADIEYRWVNNIGQAYSVGSAKLAKIAGGVLSFGGIDLKLDNTDTMKAWGELNGRNELGPVHRLGQFSKR